MLKRLIDWILRGKPTIADLPRKSKLIALSIAASTNRSALH